MPPDPVPRKLAAILAADIVGFSRLMGRDEEGTFARLRTVRAEIIDPAIVAFNGRIFKTTGDGVLAEFPSVVDAAKCAVRVQAQLAKHQAGESAERRIVLRIGINLGDVIIEGDDVYGDGVNIAARLEALCRPGGVTLSGSAEEQVRGRLEEPLVDCGFHRVKNIARPVHVFGIDLTRHGIAAIGAAPSKGSRWRRISLAAAAVLVAAIGASIVLWPNAWRALPLPWRAEAPTARATIAVLPFANMTGDAARDYFSDGITEDIVNALGRFSQLRVISSNATRAYKGRRSAAGEVGRELGVRYIVEGSVRQVGDRLRVAVELSDAEKATQLWSERYEGIGQEIPAIQERVARDIAGALAVKLTRLEQQRSVAKPVGNMEAYDLVLRARALSNRSTRAANREARDLLARAIEMAPDYAEAYVALAEAESLRGLLGWREDPDQGIRRSEELARRALALDDPGANARAHALLARAAAFFGRYDEALAEADRAIAANASDSVAHGLRAEVLLWLGRLDESIAAGETARRFDPRIGSDLGFVLGLAYFTAGRWREAVQVSDAFIARYPDNAFLHAVRAASFAKLGDIDAARKAAADVRRFSPFFQVEVFGTRFVQAEPRQRAQEALRLAGL